MHFTRSALWHVNVFVWVFFLMSGFGCSTLQEIANLRKVDFALNGVASPRLAGVDLAGVSSVDDLDPVSMIRIGSAVARNDLPLDLTLRVGAHNPESNTVSARLVRLDWTLLLNDRETISGVTEEDALIAPGEQIEFPVGVSLNLIEFFDESAANLVDLVLAAAGEGSGNIALRATPSIKTPIGTMRYPNPITIVSRSVGSR